MEHWPSSKKFNPKLVFFKVVYTSWTINVKFVKTILPSKSNLTLWYGKVTERIQDCSWKIHGRYHQHKKQPKRFWSYIKSRKQESSGIVTLKDKDRLLHSDTPTKASILNQQFQSVYTKKDIHNMPHMGSSPFPTMDNIRVSQAGIYKLLRGLKPFKALGLMKFQLIYSKKRLNTYLHTWSYFTRNLWTLESFLMTGELPTLYQSSRKGKNTKLSTSLIDLELLQTIEKYCSQHHHG